MSFWQKLFGSILPVKPGYIEAESRRWMLQCPCGEEISYWDIGGVRIGGVSRGKRTLLRCKKCNKLRWHRVYQKPAEPPQNEAT